MTNDQRLATRRRPLWRQLLSLENYQLWLVIIIVLVALFISAILDAAKPTPGRNQNNDDTIAVEVTDVAADTHRVRITTTGMVAPRAQVNLTPQISGRIEWVHAQLFAGGMFAADEVLFKVEKSDYKNAVAQRTSDVAKAKTALALEQAEANASLAEWRAIQGDNPAPPLVSRAPQIAEAKAQLSSARAALAQAKLDLKRTDYTLPFDGRVMNTSMEVGQFVQAGQSYGEVYSQDKLEISLSLRAEDIRWLGDENNTPKIVIVYEKDGTSHTMPATLTRIGALLDNATRARDVIITPDDQSALLPGMLADVTVSGSTVENAWEIPLTAWQEGGFVWRVNDEGRLEKLTPNIISTMGSSMLVSAPMEDTTIVSIAISGAEENMQTRVVNGDE